ncbi:MAG: PfkB family carbohydrate kinase [Geminicoccaceae bacterium]
MSEGSSRPPSRRRVTIADVAGLADVSMGTVSNVLNGTAGVRPATRERVEAAIRELHFRPNLLARSLTGRGRDAQQRALSPDAPRLVAVGYTSVDYTARVDVLPHRRDRITAASIEKSLGGPAANVAVIAAGMADRFPLAVELVTTIGDDADSDWVLEQLIVKHVDTIAVRRAPGQRLSRCMVLVEPDGARTVINEPFALEDSDLDRYLRPQTEGHVQCLFIEGFQVERMLDSIVAIGASGWRVAVQTTGLPAAWRTPVHMHRMAAEFDAVFLNRAVARDITNCRGGEQQLVSTLIGLIGSAPAKAVVALTLGERGALVIPPGEEPVLVPAKQVDIVDATGNGGAFVGAFLAVWLHTGDPLLAAQWGTAAGSLLTSVEGAQGATPTAAEVEAIMECRAPTAQTLAAAS